MRTAVGCKLGHKLPLPVKSHPLIQQLRAIRIKKQINQREISKIAGYDRDVVACWESGKYPPNLLAFVDFCNALGVEVVLREPETK